MNPVNVNASVEHSSAPHPKNLHVPELARILEAPKGEIETFGATPLDRVATLSQQIGVRIHLQELTYRDLPDDIPIEVIDYVHRTFARRFDNRGEANEENFTTALHYGDYQSLLSPEHLEIVERARIGEASPAELILVRELLGMKSIELACLTHPYGKHIDDILPEMRFAVEYAVSLYDGEYFDNPETVFRVKESICDSPNLPDLSKGILMTRKRKIGVLPDGTIIKERSSFVLRTDPESGFDQEIVARLEKELAENPELDWMTWLVENAKIDEIADDLLQSDDYSKAIPISSTIYAYNKATAIEVAKMKQKEDTERREIFEMDQPGLSEALHDRRDEHRAVLAKIATESQLLDLSELNFVGARTDEEVREYLSTLMSEDDD